jgi:hypothetical protein
MASMEDAQIQMGGGIVKRDASKGETEMGKDYITMDEYLASKEPISIRERIKEIRKGQKEFRALLTKEKLEAEAKAERDKWLALTGVK